MHHCLSVDEILRLLAHSLVASGAKATAVGLACCCKSFEDPALDALWGTQDLLLPLLKSLPRDVWKVEAGQFSFNRIPTKVEWCRFRKYARGMRELKVDTSQELVTPDVLLALQLRSGNDRLFPRLNKFACDGVNEGFIPSIPLFLSSKIVNIKIRFAAGSPTVMVASTIARLSILCPNLECVLVTLSDLPRDPVIIEAVSEMLLACNRDVLRLFVVNSPLTEEARRVLYQLPNLQQLWTVIQGPTSLSPMTLPNLVIINLEYDHGHEWLRGFDGATLGRLKYANFHAKSVAAPLTNFLEEFKRVALTTSAPSTLLRFAFRTIRLRNPNYSSLLVFKQLTELVVEFSCHNDCSSTVDDNIIIDLAEAMPKLRILQLGRPPCRVSTGITFKGLVTLAHRCPQLTRLCVHLQVLGFSEPASTEPPPPPKHAAIIPRMSCALTNLQVGEAPIVQRSVMAISFTLLQLFPQLLNLEYANPQWRRVVETIELFKRIDGHVLHARNTLV